VPRVQGFPGRRPVLPQPRKQAPPWSLAVHARARPPLALNTPSTPRARILRRESICFPQAHLQAGDDSILGVRRAGRYAPPWKSTDLTRLPPQAGPASAGWLRSMRPARANTDSSALTRRPALPSRHPIPGRYYDLCWTSARSPRTFAVRARRRGADTTAPTDTPGRSPRIRTTNFPLRPPRLPDDPVDGDGALPS